MMQNSQPFHFIHQGILIAYTIKISLNVPSEHDGDFVVACRVWCGMPRGTEVTLKMHIPPCSGGLQCIAKGSFCGSRQLIDGAGVSLIFHFSRINCFRRGPKQHNHCNGICGDGCNHGQDTGDPVVIIGTSPKHGLYEADE